MHKKQILIVSDGLPGHYKKTRAVALMVQKRFPAEPRWINVKLRMGLYRRVLAAILKHTRQAPNPEWLKLFYRFADELPGKPDLILSSGGKTCYMSAWLARHYGCPSVFIGQVRGVDKHCFTRIVASPLDFVDDGKHIKSVPATEVDPDVVAEAAAEYFAQTGLARRPRWTLILGGDGAGFTYTKSDWRQLFDAVCTLAERHGVRWMITTSRRTNPDAEDLFSSPAMREWADDVLVYNRDSRSVYNAYLGAADVIVCTEDSGKMLTESVASGRPVLSVRPPRAKHSEHVKALVGRFEAAGYLKRVPIERLATEPVEEFIANHQGPAEPLMQRVREEVNEFLSTLPWAA
jgi:mitochondrial fission protein ELM1